MAVLPLALRCIAGVSVLAGLLRAVVVANLAGKFPAFSGASVYTVEDDFFGVGDQKVFLKVLRNTKTGERAEVSPNAGGRTEALVLRSPTSKRLRDVLLHSRRDAADVWANTGWKGDMLIPYANRIKNGTYSLNGKTYYLERNEDRSPYGKEGLHGYLYRKQMRVQETSADNDHASVTLTYDFDGSDPGYPFLLSVALTYRLDERGLTIETKATNRETSGQPLPFHSSWHSYFAVSDISSSMIELDRCSQWNHIDVTGNSNVDSDLIPIGTTTAFVGFDGKTAVGGSSAAPTYWDDEFKAVALLEKCPQLSYRVHDPGTGDTSVLWADMKYRWVQIFTGTKHAMGEQAIAVEAMSSQCDAWNNMQGIHVLQAGESWQGSFGVYLECGELCKSAQSVI